jgi:hypothetical protein
MRSIAFFIMSVALSCATAIGQQYQVLYNFGATSSDGFNPQSNLIADNLGNLYGTTTKGGSSTASLCVGSGGCGTVFELSPNSNGSWTEKVLYDFCSAFSNGLCQDGAFPLAGLVIDPFGNLYGTTVNGGANSYCDPSGDGCGTVFKLSPQPGGTWDETILYNFCANSCLDGDGPASQLTFDTKGNLYGTTEHGGSSSSSIGGTVFMLSPSSNGMEGDGALQLLLIGRTRHLS